MIRVSFALRGFERITPRDFDGFFIPAVRPPSTRRSPQQVTDQTRDKQPTPSDVSDDDRLLRDWRFTLGARFICPTLMCTIFYLWHVQIDCCILTPRFSKSRNRRTPMSEEKQVPCVEVEIEELDQIVTPNIVWST
jgi:hypothetical protein